ncbi:MAG: hypothetical protein VX424_10995 [Actinomycetota bacterium]|nr:hypothetical protein [Actinomycetota bacterium]
MGAPQKSSAPTTAPAPMAPAAAPRNDRREIIEVIPSNHSLSLVKTLVARFPANKGDLSFLTVNWITIAQQPSIFGNMIYAFVQFNWSSNTDAFWHQKLDLRSAQKVY